ncbi:MAG: D-alanyl-D-alanine carboxypeptidase [Ruminococcaceae bacterium]|nr:D-alanyl-D-alanine carboxypeptidase [Oscillospiraceae bacterium]
MKNTISLIAMLLIFTISLSACSFLQMTPPTTVPTEPATIMEPTPPPTDPPTLPPVPPIDATASIVYDLKNHKYLHQQSSQTKIAPASITKLLTACLALDHLKTDDAITVGSELNLLQPNSSVCLLAPGHRLTVLDLLYGLLLQSGNDAAYTLAVNVARKDTANDNMGNSDAVAHFITMMNAFAQEIGMKNSHFVSPDGYDTPEQYVTADDVLLLAMKAKQYPVINMITATQKKDMKFLSGETITWTSTNLFLDPASAYHNPYVVGMKTGTTENAGTCLLTSYNDGDYDLIVFVAGCKTDDSRYVETSTLITWAIQ